MTKRTGGQFPEDPNEFPERIDDGGEDPNWSWTSESQDEMGKYFYKKEQPKKNKE